MKYCKKLITFVLITILFCGCYTLRKKFMRKKKSQEEEPVYVDFKDYPKASSKQLYNDYYLYVKAWLDDLIESLSLVDESNISNYKREKRAIEEALRNLEQIMYIFNQEGKNNLRPLYEELLSLKEKISPDTSDVERSRILIRVELLKMKFDNNFKYSKASQWIGQY